MHIDIPTDLQSFVSAAVNSGTYQSESEVLSEALRLLRERDLLRKAVQAGLDQLNRGETIPGEEVFERLRKRAAEAQRLP